MRVKIYKLIRGIPVFGSAFRIANAYVYKGNGEFNIRIAPIKLWWNRIFKKMFSVVIFVELIFLIKGKPLSSLTWEPSDSIISIFPSILGFGIGVYALMFVMPNEFRRFLTDRRDRLNFGPEIVPVDMGYPLVVFTMVMICAAINKIFPSDALTFLSACAFFYGLAMVFELVSFLFNASFWVQKINK